MSPTFTPLENRDASDVIRGFLYQIEMTIKRWIELEDDATLELERGEDIDIVQSTFLEQGTRTLEQIKLRSARASLRSPEILGALVNFFLHFKNNPGMNLRFRYLTNAQVTIERGVDFETEGSGLQTWRSFTEGRLTSISGDRFIRNLRAFLQKANRPQRVSACDWRFFRDFLDGDVNTFRSLAERVEWSFGNPDPPELGAEVEEALRETGYVGPRDIRTAHQQLIVLVINRLSAKGVKRLARNELQSEMRDVRQLNVNVPLLGMLSTLLERPIVAEKPYCDFNVFLSRMPQGQQTVELQPSLPALMATIPLAAIGGSKRTELVETVREVLKTGVTWLAFHGESGIGKTQLLVLVAEVTINKQWISFRNAPVDQLGQIFDRYLTEKTGITCHGDLRHWYSQVCERLPNDTIFFADDIPFDGNSELCSRLVVFARCVAARGIKLLSTAWHSITPSPIEQLGVGFLDIPVPFFSQKEITEFLANRGAPQQLLSNAGFLHVVKSATRGHPQLIAALVRYMERAGWKHDSETIKGVMRGDFANDVRLQTRMVLSKTLPDATRELIYRLNVVGPVINNEDIARVSEVQPPITLPADKLVDCMGVWIQNVNSTTFIISALIEQLGPSNVPVGIRRVIHEGKARAILSKGVLNQFDVQAAIDHFQQAGANEDAARVLLLGLHKLSERRSQAIDDLGLVEIWTKTDIPDAVPIGLQLLILALQISIRKRHSKLFSKLLSRFENKLRESNKADALARFGACSMLAITLSDVDAAASIRYAISALGVQDTVHDLLPEAISSRAPDMVWACSPLVRSPADLSVWLEAVGSLSDAQLQSIFGSQMAAESCRFICDRFWTTEADKPTPQWDLLDAQMVELLSKAQFLQANTLMAAISRARIVIAADYKKDLAHAAALASDVLSLLGNNKASTFLALYTLGSSSYDRNNWELAIESFDKALESGDHAFPEFWVRALLSRAVALQKKGHSGRPDCQRAVEFARTNKRVSELTLIRCLGEYSILLWEEGNQQAFFEAWQETVERILAAKANTDAWKELFVLTGNNTGYFLASGKGIQPLQNMTRPFQGMYLLYSPKLPSLYASETEWYMPASVVWLAERLGRYRESSRWALRATELAAGSPIGAEAQRLLLYATPAAIRDGQYSEALIFVSRAVEGMNAPVDELIKFAERRNDKEFRKIVEERPKQRGSLELYLQLTLGPIIVDLLTAHLSDKSSSAVTAESLKATCREMAHQFNTDSGWAPAAEAMELVFSADATLASLVTTAREHSANNRNLAALICSLGTAAVAGLAEICMAWLPALEYYEWRFSSFPLHMQLMGECVNKFWCLAVELTPGAFRQPSTLTRKLQELGARPSHLARHTMRIVVWHLGLGVAAEAKEWLERDG